MAKFASPARQAASVMKQLQGKIIESARTVANFEERLTRVAEYTQQQFDIDGLRSLTPEQARDYLDLRAEEVGQSTLNMERQAIQTMMQYVTHQLKQNETLPVIKSEHARLLESRAYTQNQVKIITDHQTERNALATEIAYAAGLRAHELLTLKPANEQPADMRPALNSKWLNRQGALYTVSGKGGLVREVLVPLDLAKRLEDQRLKTPEKYNDRGVFYEKYYALNGGHRWSSSFSAASNRALGWSAGGHGVRHSYAQERMDELQRNYLSREQALETTSQEMGHFRPNITEVYLR